MARPGGDWFGWLVSSWLALALAPCTRAQDAGAPPRRPEQAARQEPHWVALDRYHEPTSRKAFAACDRNGDDRLDIREAGASIPTMGDIARFRTLDRNRDGYVHFPEFDLRYRSLIERKAAFRFKPRQAFVVPEAARQPSKAAKTAEIIGFVVKMLNEDDDPYISKAEFAGLVKTLKQPPLMIEYFAVLDRDMSGGLSASELEPIILKFPYLLELARQATPTATVQAVEKKQLHERLDRIHPTLGRWSAELFGRADRNGDGKLDADEMQTSK